MHSPTESKAFHVIIQLIILFIKNEPTHLYIINIQNGHWIAFHFNEFSYNTMHQNQPSNEPSEMEHLSPPTALKAHVFKYHYQRGIS